MSFFNNLIKPIFKQDDKGSTLYYPALYCEGFIIESKKQKNEIIQLYKKKSVILFCFLLILLIGSFSIFFIFSFEQQLILFIFGIELPIMILYHTFSYSLYQKKIEKITKGLTKVDKLKFTGLSNTIAHCVSLFTLLISFFVELFVIVTTIGFIKREKRYCLPDIDFFGIIFGIIIIFMFIYLSFITGKAILIKFKNGYTSLF